jgi:site-specific recombinase XerD
MGDVLSALDVAPGLEDERRRDLKNAVQRVAMLLDLSKDPARVPAASRATRNRIAQLTPTDLGCNTTKTVDNVRSLVRSALQLVGAARPDRGPFKGTPVADAWGTILKKQENDAHAKDKTVATRVARWAVAHELMPHELPPDTSEHILEWNRQNSWSPHHRQKALAAMHGWNRLVAAGAPGRKIEVRLPPKFTRPLTDFPLSFQKDVRDYEDFLRHPENWRNRKGCIVAGETREIDGARKEGTITRRIMRIRYLASLLVATGFPIAEIVRINVLAAGDNVERIMKEFERRSADKLRHMKAEGIDTERGDEKTLSAVSIVKDFRAVICGWCAPKPGVLAKFKRAMKAALSAKVTFDDGTTVEMYVKAKKGHTAKNKKRLRDATADPAVLRRLITTPERVMKSIEAARKKAGTVGPDGIKIPAKPTRRQAKLFETALCTAIDLCKPLRCFDLSQLSGAYYLPPTPRERRARFEFRASKNRRDIIIKVEGELLHCFEIFLANYRPVLLGEDEDLGFMFVGLRGRAISANTLGDRIRRFIRAETGLLWNCHLFRHFDAWVAKEAGADVGTVADLLSISVQTAHTTYDSDRQEDAQDTLHASMDAIRVRGRRR